MRALILGFFLSGSVFSMVHEDTAKSMVPHGKLVEHLGRDYTIKTWAGTKVEIGFDREGNFKHASGRNLNKGDELEPGDGLISLSSIAKNIQPQGLKTEGFWSLEHDQKMGWIYELNAEHIVCAKTGKIIKK